MDVAGYQIAIFLVVAVITAALGSTGLVIAVGGAVLWTLVMVFTKGLMAMQFITIIAGAIAGVVLRSAGGYGIAAIVVGGLIWINSNNDRPAASTTAAAAASTPATPGAATFPHEGRTKLNPRCYTRPPWGLATCPQGETAYIPWTENDYEIAERAAAARRR